MLKLLAIGFLGKDAETKDVNGKKVIEFSVAQTDKYISNNVPVERTTWLNCNYWTEKTTIAQYLKKGTQVFIEGVPSTNAYTNKNGQVVADFRLRLSSIQLLGTKPSIGENANNASNVGSAIANVESSNIDTNSQYDDVKDDLPF